MTDLNTPSSTTQEAISLGQKLKQAREALNLSIEDVAKKTNLKKSHIESLENDIFILQNVAPTFVRGYVRNYTRFLRLPESLVASVNYGEVVMPKESKRIPPPNVNQKSQGQWVKYLTILVLLSAVGMTLIWWWQDYQKEQESREHLVSTAPVVASATPAPTLPTPAPAPAEPAPVTAVPVSAEPAEHVANAPQNQPAPNVSPAENRAVNANATPSAEVPATNAEQPVNVLQQMTINEDASATDAATEAVPAAVENAELRIEITGKESWITVKDATGKKSLAERLYTNGEVLTFNDNEQYRLTIGAPANVKLYYKGQEVPLKIDGRVARIRLPLAQ